MGERNHFEVLLNEINAVPPIYIYHYGSMGSLLGILQSQAIWASDVSSLNDKSEIVYVNEVLEHAMGNKFFSLGIKDNAWFHGIALQIRSIKARVGRCVASFCEDNDQLSLWRPYAADGRGASIGFLASALSRNGADQGFDLRKVIYDRDVQYNICMEYLDKLFKTFDIIDKVPELSSDVLEDLRQFVNTIGILFKHPSFRDEREWRLVSGNVDLYDKRWKYRAAENMIVPYLVVDLCKIFRKDREVIGLDDASRPPFIITLGPRARRASTAPALQAITYSILEKGYGVSISSSPYQG